MIQTITQYRVISPTEDDYVVADDEATALRYEAAWPRVKAGAALLDKRLPAWADYIDLGTFDLSSVSHCVVGQLLVRRLNGILGTDEYGAALSLLGVGEFVPGEGRTAAVAVGFNSEPPFNYRLLGELWVREIERRRKPPLPSVQDAMNGVYATEEEQP